MTEPQQTYRVEVAGVVRDLPLIEVAPGVRIAFLDCLVDAEFVQAAAYALAPRLKPHNPEVLVTPEAKSIPLAYALAVQLGCEFVTLRKSHKAYMKEVISAETVSISTGVPQRLFLDARYLGMLAGRRVVLIDDVISTGSTLEGMQKLMDTVGADVVAEASVFTEGDQEKWQDIIALGHLPVFVSPDDQG
ncbi:MAG: adenine phosphoribosyltransferase [Anaerolineae bacterium]|nr:adenine phosphoribosyltransferase [Anaerolineae bacterium]